MKLDRRHVLQGLLRRPAIMRLFAALDGNGEELRIVGGAVRDALLGLAVDEIDLAITALPEETVARARRGGLKTVPTGLAHGTITVIVDRIPFEITTLREDVETDGRRAVVRFGRDFDADGLRRDFTINALSLDGSGQLHDPAGGLADLGIAGLVGPDLVNVDGDAQPVRVRFIGDAETRIREDYLRSLRFFRFHARFGQGAPDAAGFAAAIRCRDGLESLSRERIRAELLKLLVAPGAASAITAMSGAGLLQRVSGIVAEPGRLARLMRRDQIDGAQPDPLLRLAACGVRIVEDAQALQDRLRLSGAEASRLAKLARAMEALHGMEALANAGARALAATHGAGAVNDALTILAGRQRPQIAGEARQTIAAMAAGTTPEPVLPLRGADLLAMGVKPGPGIGTMIGELRRQWLAEGCPEGDSVRAALLAKAAELATRQAG